MMLHARAIKHIAVNGSEMYYVRIWKENENKFVLVNVRKTVYDKVISLSGGMDNIQKGGKDVLDNSSPERRPRNRRGNN